MKTNAAFLVLVLIVAACGDTNFVAVPTGPQTPGYVAPTTPAAPAVSEIEQLVDGYNKERALVGNDPIQPGLFCTLYNVPNMPSNPCLTPTTGGAGCSAIPSSSGFKTVTTFGYVGQFNQPNAAGTAGFAVLPAVFQPLYPTNFELVCTGFLVNTDYAYHTFSTSSDDGSLLYVNGLLQVNNDGLHSIQTVNGAPFAMEPGLYSLQLNYFQGPGNVALIVNEDGQLLPSANLYH
jgi:hypothetical protein